MFDLLKEGLEEALAFEKRISKKAKVKKIRIDPAEISSKQGARNPNHTALCLLEIIDKGPNF